MTRSIWKMFLAMAAALMFLGVLLWLVTGSPTYCILLGVVAASLAIAAFLQSVGWFRC